jgi:hypothetical protein
MASSMIKTPIQRVQFFEEMLLIILHQQVRYKVNGSKGPRFEKEFEHIQTHTFDLYPKKRHD